MTEQGLLARILGALRIPITSVGTPKSLLRDIAQHYGYSNTEVGTKEFYLNTIVSTITGEATQGTAQSLANQWAEGLGYIGTYMTYKKALEYVSDNIGEYIPKRRLLGDDGEPLTTSTGEVLQHNEPQEDDMLYTDYMVFRDSKLGTPVNIEESDGEVEVLTISEDVPAGTYMIGVSMVSQFTDGNDALEWRVEGDLASPQFFDEAKDDDESIPQEFSFPIEHTGGTIGLQLICSVGGQGNADIDIQAANFTIQRVA